eukprot:gnl/TRDRNA2_/TRDRNA2_176572_c1_seq7.p1 gnl/TRDRNA2_/TRDRNA2_176572_c1~~gnl/TRDRNA2_/TRDRNA2_176572_c1_seq7.p1  ORF type:complete len:185 (-),score=26.48 gnl/TRDRNA2_/TRDRNA2_176572_c1_seq7:49-603(-)
MAANAQEVMATCYGLNLPSRVAACALKVANSSSSDRFTVAKIHAVLARSYSLNSATRCLTARAKVANSFASASLAGAKAHVILTKSCTQHTLTSTSTRRSTALASATNSISSDNSAAANAQHTLARLWGGHRLVLGIAEVVRAVASRLSSSFTVVNAHAVLAMACASKSLTLCSVDLAKAKHTF